VAKCDQHPYSDQMFHRDPPARNIDGTRSQV
jgi:hypothetical protein